MNLLTSFVTEVSFRCWFLCKCFTTYENFENLCTKVICFKGKIANFFLPGIIIVFVCLLFLTHGSFRSVLLLFVCVCVKQYAFYRIVHGT